MILNTTSQNKLQKSKGYDFFWHLALCFDVIFFYENSFRSQNWKIEFRIKNYFFYFALDQVVWSFAARISEFKALVFFKIVNISEQKNMAKCFKMQLTSLLKEKHFSQKNSVKKIEPD